MSDLKEFPRLASLLPAALELKDVISEQGGLVIRDPESKQVATIYLDKGLVTAVDHLNYETNLWNQLHFEGMLTQMNIKSLIRSHKSQRDSLYKLLKRTRTKFPNSSDHIQEYILGALDDIYTWEGIEATWETGKKFQYNTADIEPFPLAQITSVLASREIFKYEKYTTLGFQDDKQFLHGEVRLGLDKADRVNVTAANNLEQAFLAAGKFTVGKVQSTTGYSIISLITTLDNFQERCSWTIENPYGRHSPRRTPVVPSQIPVVETVAEFSLQTEEQQLAEVFATEYHVPEPALLESITDGPVENDGFLDFLEETQAAEIDAAQLAKLKDAALAIQVQQLTAQQAPSEEPLPVSESVTEEPVIPEPLPVSESVTEEPVIPEPLPVSEPVAIALPGPDPVVVETILEEETIDVDNIVATDTESVILDEIIAEFTTPASPKEDEEEMANLDITALVERLASALEEKQLEFQIAEEALTEKNTQIAETEKKVVQAHETLQITRKAVDDAQALLNQYEAALTTQKKEAESLNTELLVHKEEYNKARNTISALQ